MKSQRDPRLVIALILLLVAVAFLGGTMRLIGRAHAATASPILAGNTAKFNLKSASALKKDHTAQEVTPTETENEAVDQASSQLPSADTGGIIALAIVIVVTILLGAAVGVRTYSPKKPTLK